MARLTSTVLAPDGTPVVHHRGDPGESAAAVRHEAAMLALARGPGVVDLVATGEDDDGGAWLRTRYLAGGTLAEVAQAHGEVASMAALAQVAATLADLHDRGIVHGRLSSDHVVGGPGGATLCGFSAAVASVSGGRVEPGIDVGAFAVLVAGVLTGEDERSRRARRSAAGLAGPAPVTNLRAVAVELAGLAADGGWVQPPPAPDTRGGAVPASQPHGVPDVVWRTARPDRPAGGGRGGGDLGPAAAPHGHGRVDDGGDADDGAATASGDRPVDDRWPGAADRGFETSGGDGRADGGWVAGQPHDGARVVAPHAARHPRRGAGRAAHPARLGLLGAGVAGAVVLVAVGALVLGRDEAPGLSGPTEGAAAASPTSDQAPSDQARSDPVPSDPVPPTSDGSTPTSAPSTTDVPLPAQVWPEPEPVPTEDPAPGAAEAPETVAAVVEHDGVRYRIGRPGDIVVVGDWDCDGAPTPSVVRPDDGSIWSFRSWASGGEVVVAEALGYAAAPVAATAAPEREGCDVLAITTADGRRVVVRPG